MDRRTNKLIETPASRVRMNMFGALNLESMDVVTKSFDSINSTSVKEFLTAVRNAYPDAP
jgi:hypothetical protein